MMEDNPEESVRNNVDGTRVIARLVGEIRHEEVCDGID